MRYFLLVVLVLLQGCQIDKNSYKVTNKRYTWQHEAAEDFFESNKEVLRKMKTEQEMLGWIVRCEDGYAVTTYKIGTASNPVDINEKFGDCYKVAFMHSHPHPPIGMTTDRFSPADLNFSMKYPLYMMAQENCFLRYASKNTYQNPRGSFVAIVDCPKRNIYKLK